MNYDRKTASFYHHILERTIAGIYDYGEGTIEVLRSGDPVYNTVNGVRENITKLTKKSRDRALFVISTTRTEFRSMITLTYGANWPRDGQECKRHLRLFLEAYRKRCGNNYYWFIEFQKRGAPHYHILTSRRVISKLDMNWLAQTWCDCQGIDYGIVYCDIRTGIIKDCREEMVKVHMHPSSWGTIRHQNGAIRYVSKYALKMEQKTVPDGYRNIGRFWGASYTVSRARKTPKLYLMGSAELRLTLRTFGHKTADWDVIPRYLFGVG